MRPYTGNIVMFPRSTSTCLQRVVALGPIAFLIVSPNLIVIYSLSEVVYSQVGDTVTDTLPRFYILNFECCLTVAR